MVAGSVTRVHGRGGIGRPGYAARPAGDRQILRQHPDLRPAEVYAALAYFHDHHDSILAAIEAGKSRAERHRGPELVSRDELLRRRAAAQPRSG